MGNIKVVLWDFDGVILDSMAVRDWGFKEIFKGFDDNLVDQLITYHRANGGLSRYVKIRYFYESILGRSITEEKVLRYAEEFSELMKRQLINPDNLILDSVDFIKANYSKYKFHIVSGSDQLELRYLCSELQLMKYFISIHGSPTPKSVLISRILVDHSYNSDEICLIGDSVNDLDAANINKIRFMGYNNISLKDSNYIENFKELFL